MTDDINVFLDGFEGEPTLAQARRARQFEGKVMLLSGVPPAEVARRLRASVAAVFNWRRDLVVRGEMLGNVAQPPGEALERLRSDATNAKLAGELGVSPGNVRAWRQVAGVAPHRTGPRRKRR